MEPEMTELASDRARDAVISALRAALEGHDAARATLGVSVASFTRARKRLGRRPEEIIVELKSVIASSLDAHAGDPAIADLADVVGQRAIRLAIQTYFEES